MSNKNLKAVDVLGVKIHDVSLEEAVDTVISWLKQGGKHFIVTPNPEFVMAAQDDEEFKWILNSADLAVPDGVGLKLFSDLQSNSPGIDLMEMLIKEASEKGFKIGLLGGQDMVAKETAECLQKRYPKLKVSYAFEGPVIPASAGIYTNKELWIPDQVRDDKVDILFVAFGQVKQEKWIAKNLPNIPVIVAMGVGGAFDYLSGKVTRAPRWMRKLGLEWLFRLVIQPWRIKRQLVLIKFAWLIIKNKLAKLR